MKNLTLALKAVVESRAEVGDTLKQPGDAVLIQRGQPRWLLLKCPCGCGDEIPVNLDKRAGKAWRLYGNTHAPLSLFPSVWRDTGCESHFIIWRDEILLFGGWNDDVSPARVDPQRGVLYEQVRVSWPTDGWASYVDVADLLGAIPWDVLEVCRLLVSNGLFIEGRGQERDRFRRRS